MCEIKLQDNYVIHGDTIEGFVDAIETIQNVTFFDKVELGNIELLSLIDEDNSPDNICFWRCSPKAITRPYSAPPVGKLKIETLRKKNVSDEIIDELRESSKLMLNIGGKTFFTSPNLISTMISRVDLGGRHFFTPSFNRDQYIAEAFDDNALKEATLMYRQVLGTRKAFALHSGSYGQIPQIMLRKVINNIEHGLGQAKCLRWEVNHNISFIYLEFPEKAKDFDTTYGLPHSVVPGLYLATSDTGDSSITARGTWRISNAVSSENEYRKRHKGEIEPTDLVDEIDANIFSRYTKLPERLCELLTIDISDPKKAFRYAFKNIGMVKAIGKKIEKQLFENLCLELDPSMHYTAYDIATTIMTLSGRALGLTKYTKGELEKVAIRAAFVNFEEFIKESPALILTA